MTETIEEKSSTEKRDGNKDIESKQVKQDTARSKSETSSPKKNIMRSIKIAKITLNIGAGKNEEILKKGIKLLKKLTPLSPVKTTTNKRIPGWGLRPGLQIGCKVTVRKNTKELLKKLLIAKENTLSSKNFDDNGNFSFGVPEYIDIEGLEYDPELKIMGLEVAVTLERPGFRTKHRKIKTKSIGNKHKITKEEAIAFVTDKMSIKIE